MENKKAAVIMAYGSPENINDIDAYLQDIFGKMPVPPDARADNLKKYTLFGNKSPSNHILESLTEKLTYKLSDRGVDTFLAFKHWHPKLEVIADRIVEDNYSDVVELPLFPFPSDGVYSSYSVPFSAELEKNGYKGRRHSVNGIYQYDGYLSIWVSLIKKILQKGNYDRLVLTAHSLPTGRSPEVIYKESFYEFSRKIANSFPSIKTITGFQSRSKYGSSWLEPAIQKVVTDEIEMKSALVAPIGFCYEHLEVLYDLDLDFSKFLSEKGIKYARVKLMNDSDDFVKFLSSVIMSHLQ